MAGISLVFNIGRRSLSANQKALQTTSQNIANVSTVGYSRQEAVFSATNPENGRPGQIGTGVETKEVRRIVDRFVEAQIVSSKSNFGRLEIEESLFRRIESAFGDAEGTGINQALNDFFASLNDVSNNPHDLSARVSLIERGEALIQRFHKSDTQFQDIRNDANRDAVAVIGDINLLAGQIAKLNGEIKQAEFTGQNANDLRDVRQRHLNDLADKIDITTIEDGFGQTTVFVGSGKPLIDGELSGVLEGMADAADNGYVNVGFKVGSGSAVDITALISSGRLKGLLDMRDQVIPDYLNTLDQLAAATINEINQQHRAGFGLDGSTATDFFSPLTPSSTGLSANTGSAVVAVTISNPTALTFDAYDLTFAGGNYTLTNRDTGASTTGVYVDPTTVTFEGLDVAISSTPAAGDVFQISAHKGASGLMSVSLTDPNRVAASSTLAGIPGDNGNALLLSGIQDRQITALSSSSLQGYYSAFMGRIGVRSQATQRNAAVEEAIRSQLQNLREEVSGVSLDEEMTNIIRFQRAYEASARVITMADELLQTVLGIMR
ncbi:MAG: flagellar hook-associated protein FlgK [Nitrospiria bacterium]